MAQTTLLHSCCRYLPGECSRRVESDVDDGGLDRFGFPPLGERDPYLPFSHSAWAPVTWLVVAEAEHVVAPTRGDYFSQAADIALAILVIEGVEEPTVENGVEPLTQLDEAQGVEDEEPRLQAPFGRLRFG